MKIKTRLIIKQLQQQMKKAQHGNNLGVQEKVRIKMILMVCLDLIQTEMDLSQLVK